jgi:branched-chain amino acid transport system substrate-binding protein
MRLVRIATFAALSLTVAACGKKQDEQPQQQQAAAPAAAPAGKTILIGHVASMTGEQATFGQSTDNAIRLAIKEANAAGGVNGKQLEVKTYDDQGKPEEAAIAATRLIVQDKVAILLGEVASSRSLAMAPIADQHQVPMISPTSTNPRVTKDGDKTRPYVFRVCFIDPFQGTVMAKFASENLKLKKAAILRDVGNDYSVGLADFFAAKFKEMGGTIVADESFKAGDQDFKAQLTTIKNKKPELIYVPAYYTDVALAGRQARELGIKVPLAGGDGWDSSKLYEIAQGALDGSFFSNHYTHESPEPRVQEFVKKYKEAYGEIPDALAALGYDAALVAIDAMKKTPDLNGPKLAEALAATKSFPGVAGTISLDQDHNAVKSAVVIGVEKNAPKYVATVNP